MIRNIGDLKERITATILERVEKKARIKLVNKIRNILLEELALLAIDFYGSENEELKTVQGQFQTHLDQIFDVENIKIYPELKTVPDVLPYYLIT